MAITIAGLNSSPKINQLHELTYGDYKLKVRNISFKDEAELNEISLGITIIPPVLPPGTLIYYILC